MTTSYLQLPATSQAQQGPGGPAGPRGPSRAREADRAGTELQPYPGLPSHSRSLAALAGAPDPELDWAPPALTGPDPGPGPAPGPGTGAQRRQEWAELQNQLALWREREHQEPGMRRGETRRRTQMELWVKAAGGA